MILDKRDLFIGCNAYSDDDYDYNDDEYEEGEEDEDEDWDGCCEDILDEDDLDDSDD